MTDIANMNGQWILLAGIGGYILNRASGPITEGSSSVKSWFKRKTTANVTLMGDHYEAFSLKVARLSMDTDVMLGGGIVKAYGCDGPVSQIDDDIKLIPPRFAPGARFISVDGRRILINVVREKFNDGWIETAIVTTKRKHFDWLVDYVNRAVEERKLDLRSGLPVYSAEGGWWRQVCTRPFRSIDTVVHPDAAPQRMLDEIRRWLTREAEFTNRGENYQIGFLLHGAAGTGKTSTAIAIASELKRPLYVLTPTFGQITSIGSILSSVPKRSVLLIEECEQIFGERSGEDAKLDRETAIALCHFDGAMSKHGLIRIYTTNHPERLDKAFRRPGRCDFEYEFFKTERYAPLDTCYSRIEP